MSLGTKKQFFGILDFSDFAFFKKHYGIGHFFTLKYL